MLQKCTGCATEKSLEDFPFRSRKLNKRSKRCKTCFNVWHREHYKANKERYKKQVYEHNRALVNKVAEYKRNRPCADCSVSYPSYVMEFDHISEDKVDNVSSLASAGCAKKVWVEIKKCELVCANCHRERTHVRKTQV